MSEIYNKLTNLNYSISIPSRNRIHLIEKRIGIWKHIDPFSFNYLYEIIVRESEASDYRKAVDNYAPVFVVPDDSTIADKRQKCFDIAKENFTEYLFIIDDDINLYFRDENLSSKYTSRHEDFIANDCFNKILYESIQLCNEEYPIVGLPLKLGSQGIKYMFPKNIPIIRFVCYHVPTLIKEGIKINEMPVPFMSDRYVQLKLLSKGYKSLSNARWCCGDPGTGYKGGCSETRTVEAQSESAKQLCKEFPGYVDLKIKNNGLWDEERLDCTIDWKRFLPEGEEPYIPAEEGMKIILGTNTFLKGYE